MTPITLPGDSPEGYLAAAPGTQILDQNGGTWTKVSGISSTGWRSADDSTETPTLTVPTVAAMQVLIDAGSQAIGQLYYIEADRSTRRYEGGSLSTIINDYPQLNPEGYATMTSVKTSNITATVQHDGTGGATGICYSVDGGTPVYQANGAATNTSLSIPHKQGAPINIAIWPASSATSGRKGNMTRLSLHSNQLTSFNGAGLTALIELYLFSNQLTSFNGAGLSAVTNLNLYSNRLTSFNGTGLSAVTYLNLFNNKLTSFNGAGLSALTFLNLFNNNLTSFNGAGLSALTDLYLDSNNLTSFNGAGLTALTELRLNSNQLTSFNGAGLTALTELRLDSNQLTSFNGTGLTAVTYLHLGNNKLTSFNGTGLSALNTLHLISNQLTSFNGTGLTALEYLNLSNNQLTSFNGTGLSALNTLYLTNNNLTSFNGTGLTTVTRLYLTNNQLTSFNGTGLSALNTLNLSSNQLTSFNGAGLTAVTLLTLDNNQISSFIVGELQLYDVYSYYLALNLINQQLDAAAIQQIYDDLPDGTSYGGSYPNTIDVTGNPGAGIGSGTTPATATAQGWIVVGDTL